MDKRGINTRKFYRRLISALICAFVTILSISLSPLKAEAATMTTDEYYKRVAEFQALYPDGKNSLYETFTYNGVTLGWTCHGYARKATGYIFGVECKNGSAAGWVRYNASSTNSQIDNLAIGDLVRFRSYSGSSFDHTIFVTNISGDTITYTDCNGDGKGTVRWNKTMTKGSLSAKLILPLHDDGGYGWITHYTGSPFGKGDPQPTSNVIYPGMAGFTTGGAYWWNGTGYGINGTMKYTYANGNTRDSWGKWSFNLSSIGGNGYYKVEAYIPNNHATTQNAHYHILHAGKTDYKSVNQNSISNAWVDLGTYDFTIGNTAAVELDDATGEPFVSYKSTPKVGFDAIRLTFVSAIDLEKPSGSWITPKNGGSAITPGSMTLSVNAADNKSVAKVIFHANYDGQWHELGTDSHGGNGVYSLTWNYNISPQNVEIHAHLYDTSNNWTNIAGPIVTFSKPAEATIAATDPYASEPGTDKGIFTISRQGGDTNNSLTVTYTVGGTAAAGNDYSGLSGSAVIPAGEAFTTIDVRPLEDNLIENVETVIITLSPNSAYSIGAQGNAKVMITDNDKPKVIFNSQGGSVVSSKTANYNRIITAPAVPTKTGYAFGGWYKEASCRNAWNFATDKVTANVTLYAKWIINKYNVTFNSQGGSVVSSKTANHNSIITAPEVPTKTGYTFGGWYKEASCINAWNFAADKVTANVSLYAKWILAKPSAPALTTAASSSYNSIKLAWGAVTGASGYEVYRSTSSTGAYSKIATTTSTSFTNTGLTTGAAYYYKVKAYTTVGTTKVYSDYSSVKSARPVPSTPTNPSAVKLSSTSIKITWGGVSGASGYEIYSATSSTGTYSLKKDTTSLYYTNTGLITGRTYYYKVRAYSTVGTTKIYGNWILVNGRL